MFYSGERAGRFLAADNITILEQWVDPIKFKLLRDHRVNPKGNPSQVVLRHGTEFILGCYSCDAWTAQGTFSRLAETKMKCVLIFKRRFKAQIFSALLASFLFSRAFLSLYSFGIHSFAAHLILGSLTSKPQWQRHHYSVVYACVKILCSFGCCSKQQPEKATFCVFERTRTTAVNF